ncbi:MAG TPA: DUF3037 domain-containing protein [Gemmatimonadaceae bacterium]|nr:DUF3037 domain-containing protein [Gemmatimonadaceae bacterium]
MTTLTPDRWIAYDFAVLRAVPHPHIGAFVPVGVVVHARTQEFIGMRAVTEPAALRDRVPDTDVELLSRYLVACRAICDGDASAGPVALSPPSERFHWLTAPRSDVIQSSPVHEGVCADPVKELEELFAAYVEAPASAQTRMRRVAETLERISREAGARAERAMRMAECIREAGSYRWVGIYDVTEREIAVIAWSGPEAPTHARFPRALGLNGAAVRDGAPVVIQDVSSDPRYLTTLGSTRAEAVFPVRSTGSGAIVGTIDVESERVNAFSAADRSLLEGCAIAVQGLWQEEIP